MYSVHSVYLACICFALQVNVSLDGSTTGRYTDQKRRRLEGVLPKLKVCHETCARV